MAVRQRASWVLAGALTAGAAIALWLRRRPTAGAMMTGPAARGAEVARLGTRVGATVAANRARRVFVSAERKSALDAELELRTAEDVAATLGNMKGALMKVGQLASFVDDGMPEPVRQALGQLQADAPPMSPDLAAEVVERELGSPPDRMFAEWDPVPIAAASIGQVHRAITRDNLAVAVKVQYPGVEDAIRADLSGFDLAMLPAPALYKNFDMKPFVEEVRARILEELDYRTEAANQRLFADFYRGHPFIHVPDVIDSLSTGRVLTTELAAGARFSDIETWHQAERNLAAEAIYRFVFRSLYRLRAFNGDPHPGNYLFRPNGRVTFLDFGLVKRYSQADVDLLLGLARSVVAGDKASVRRASEAAGYYPPEDRPFRCTPEYASEVVRRFFFGRMSHGDAVKYANMPARWVILQRINVGLIAILGRLHAEANWRRIVEEIWPFMERPPSTPLGEEEAEWWAQKWRAGGRLIKPGRTE
jgi:predicted unusual protein kinase regulating ubiquinone biosynthesis (AarF/ABC1/UbiB family)